MKYPVLFSLKKKKKTKKKKNDKVFMYVVCCSRDWRFKGQYGSWLFTYIYIYVNIKTLILRISVQHQSANVMVPEVTIWSDFSSSRADM